MTKNSLIHLDLLQLVYAYALILLSVSLARFRQIGQEQQMLWASLRMVVQLPSLCYRCIYVVRAVVI